MWAVSTKAGFSPPKSYNRKFYAHNRKHLQTLYISWLSWSSYSFVLFVMKSLGPEHCEVLDNMALDLGYKTKGFILQVFAISMYKVRSHKSYKIVDFLTFSACLLNVR